MQKIIKLASINKLDIDTFRETFFYFQEYYLRLVDNRSNSRIVVCSYHVVVKLFSFNKKPLVVLNVVNKVLAAHKDDTSLW